MESSHYIPIHYSRIWIETVCLFLYENTFLGLDIFHLLFPLNREDKIWVTHLETISWVNHVTASKTNRLFNFIDIVWLNVHWILDFWIISKTSFSSHFPKRLPFVCWNHSVSVGSCESRCLVGELEGNCGFFPWSQDPGMNSREANDRILKMRRYQEGNHAPNFDQLLFIF